MQTHTLNALEFRFRECHWQVQRNVMFVIANCLQKFKLVFSQDLEKKKKDTELPFLSAFAILIIKYRALISQTEVFGVLSTP